MTEPPRRRLAAILAADIVGYARMVEADEAGALSAVRELWRDLLIPQVAAFDGRLVKSMGDGAIVEFASVAAAVECAIGLQEAVAARQEATPPERRLVFRMGLNSGDVVVEGEDLLGAGVIVAARLEQLREAGGVLISGTVYDQLQGRLGDRFELVGEQQVKNLSQPVRVYRVRPAKAAAEPRPALRLPDRPSIAVLPFTNIGGGAEHLSRPHGRREASGARPGRALCARRQRTPSRGARAHRGAVDQSGNRAAALGRPVRRRPRRRVRPAGPDHRQRGRCRGTAA